MEIREIFKMAVKINADQEMKALLSIIHFVAAILLVAVIFYGAILIVRKLKYDKKV